MQCKEGKNSSDEAPRAAALAYHLQAQLPEAMCPAPYTHLRRRRQVKLRQERHVYSNHHPGCPGQLRRSDMNGDFGPTDRQLWPGEREDMQLLQFAIIAPQVSATRLL